ncbi:MAG: DUF3043 domain-containing protein [Pseudolysinimonas sp.]
MAKTTPSSTAVDPAPETPTGKGHATPTRKEKEEARKQPLVSGDRAAARRKERVAMQAQRDRARVGMAAGDEKFLPARDRGPQKRYVRDYVDARYSVGELMIPLMLLVIVLTFIPNPEFQSIGNIALWGFLFVAVIDCIVVGFIVVRRLGAKFGTDRVEKVRWYAAMRAMQLRLMRLPKPQVKRGQYPV